MNYDHAFHAGNPADVIKHAALALVLTELVRRHDPVTFIDTHAGAGRYPLADPRGEWTQGIGRLASRSAGRRLPELEPYLATVSFQDQQVEYPGSPAIAQAILRQQDRLELFELNRRDKAKLDQATRGDARVHTHAADGYAGLAKLPLEEGARWVVLIDPPFEDGGEWDQIDRAIQRAAIKRPGAALLLWFPIKAAPPHRGRPEALRRSLEAARVRGVALELRARGGMLLPRTDRPKVRGALEGSGLLFVGAPSRAVARFCGAIPELARTLARDEEHNAWEASWFGWG